jgi:Uma2 family endonuclease
MATDIELVRRRFTLDEYHRMAATGVLNEDDRVELIRGEIVQMTPIGRDHASCVARLTHLVLGRLHGRVVLWPQNPLMILPDSEPQPDIILLVWRDDFYRHALPGPSDVALLVEVADTSLRYDRRVKGLLYAEAGVREYWIVDLAGDALDVYREPGAGGFERAERLARGATLAPLAFPDVSLAVADILG